ncbi:unnamed protein product [Chrysoparadoxa australica]
MASGEVHIAEEALRDEFSVPFLLSQQTSPAQGPHGRIISPVQRSHSLESSEILGLIAVVSALVGVGILAVVQWKRRGSAVIRRRMNHKVERETKEERKERKERMKESEEDSSVGSCRTMPSTPSPAQKRSWKRDAREEREKAATAFHSTARKLLPSLKKEGGSATKRWRRSFGKQRGRVPGPGASRSLHTSPESKSGEAERAERASSIDSTPLAPPSPPSPCESSPSVKRTPKWKALLEKYRGQKKDLRVTRRLLNGRGSMRNHDNNKGADGGEEEEEEEEEEAETQASSLSPSATSSSDPLTWDEITSTSTSTSHTSTPPDSALPRTFLQAEPDNPQLALLRWRETLVWREEMGADKALQTPHPNFSLCKKYYPSCFHGRDLRGNVVYIEQAGAVDIEVLCSSGVDHDSLLWHYMYQMEYLYQVLSPRDDQRVTIVLDVAGIKMKDLYRGEVVKFLKAAVGMTTRHYPSRSARTFVINVPSWFSMVFKLVKPLLDERIQAKLCIYGAAYHQPLKEWVGEASLPTEYGGASEHALGLHPMEQELRSMAETVLLGESGNVAV